MFQLTNSARKQWILWIDILLNSPDTSHYPAIMLCQQVDEWLDNDNNDYINTSPKWYIAMYPKPEMCADIYSIYTDIRFFSSIGFNEIHK